MDARQFVEDALSAVDALLDGDRAPLDVLGSADLVGLTRSLEVVRRCLSAVDHRVVAELDTRAVAGEYARASTLDLLVSELRVAPGEARMRVAHARDLGPRRTLTGEPLPPILPVCAEAVRRGEIAAAHVSVVVDCLDAVPSSFDSDVLEIVETTLVDAARHEHPGALRRTAALLLARLDPDGDEPRQEDLIRRRDLTLTRSRDGSGRLVGRLTPEASALWGQVLDSLSAPAVSDDGEPDPRTDGQRRHDAVADAACRLLGSGTLPQAGGVPVTVLARATLADVTAESGVALTSRGDVLPLRHLLSRGDAEIVPVLFDEAGAVLALGRTRRLASRAQRLALAARDGGCCFPGCDRPAGWTEVHHVVPWALDGRTDVDNMCLLCRFHHREFEGRGWAVQMSSGVPEWIPPPWLDPGRRPRRNRTHRLPVLSEPVDMASDPDASMGAWPRGDASNGAGPCGDAPGGDAPGGDAPGGDAPGGDAPGAEASSVIVCAGGTLSPIDPAADARAVFGMASVGRAALARQSEPGP